MLTDDNSCPKDGAMMEEQKIILPIKQLMTKT
jgi:hypothetical protein